MQRHLPPLLALARATCRCSWDHHTEFAVGLDWSVLEAGVLASAGWDEQVAVWHMDGAP